MAGNNSLQMLRGTRSVISASTATLLAGQPLYDLTNNLLYVGDGSTTQIKSKAPIAAGSIKKADGTEVLGVNSNRARLAFGDANLEIWDGTYYLEGQENDDDCSKIYYEDGQLRLEHSSDGYRTTDSYLKLSAGEVTISAAGDVDQGSGTGEGATLILSDTEKQYSNGEGHLLIDLSRTCNISDHLDWGQGNLDMKVGSFGSLTWAEDEYKLELGDSANNGKVTSTFIYNGEDKYSFTTSLALESSARSTMTLCSEEKINLKAQLIDYSAGENMPFVTGEYSLLNVSTTGVLISANSTGASSGYSSVTIEPTNIKVALSTMNYLNLSSSSMRILQSVGAAVFPSCDITLNGSEIGLQRVNSRGLKLTNSTAYFGSYIGSTGIVTDNSDVTYIDSTGLHIAYSSGGKINLSSGGLNFTGYNTISSTANSQLYINATQYDKSITAYNPMGQQCFKIDMLYQAIWAGSSPKQFKFPMVSSAGESPRMNILGLATCVYHNKVTTSASNSSYGVTFIGSTSSNDKLFIRAVSTSGAIISYPGLTAKTIAPTGSTYNVNVGTYLSSINEIVITNLSTQTQYVGLCYSNMLGSGAVLNNYNVSMVSYPASQITIQPCGFNSDQTLNVLVKCELLTDNVGTGIS